MLKKIREVLLTQHIGSVLIALLGWQVMVEIVTLIVRLGFWFFRHWHTQAVWDSPGAPFRWDSLIFSVVTVALYQLTAYLLARWLYPEVAPPAATETEAQSQVQPEQPWPEHLGHVLRGSMSRSTRLPSLLQP
jgi:hypothetical protein